MKIEMKMSRSKTVNTATCFKLAAFMFCFLIISFSSPAAGQAAGSDSSISSESISSEEDAIDSVTQPFGDPDSQPAPEPPADPGVEDECDWYLDDQAIQEQSQEVLRSVSCHTFRWFDGLWGDSYDYPEQAVNGLLTVGAEYRQYDGFDPRLRFKVRAPLPNMSSRWDLLLGRVDEQAFISDTQGQDRTFYNPGIVDRGDQDSWLLGLGHRRRGKKSGWDWSVGVRLRLPPRPYVKAQWLYNRAFSEKSDLRFRQTFFWRSDEGFGTTSRGDLAYGINLANVLRWEGVATVSEETEGTKWYFGQTWYHLFEGNSAYSLLTFVRGETASPVELKEYGFNLIWRRPFTRDWMYLSFGPSLTWPREYLDEKREASLGFGVWIEMQFGNWRY
jgi:hypothetical protein